MQSDAAKFDYGVMDGYRKWGGICQKGDSIPQSPINIPAKTASAALRAPTGVHSPLALAAHFVLNFHGLACVCNFRWQNPFKASQESTHHSSVDLPRVCGAAGI